MKHRKDTTPPVHGHTPLPPNLSLEFTELSSAEYNLIRCKAELFNKTLKINIHNKY